MDTAHVELCWACSHVTDLVAVRRQTVWGKRKVMVDDEFHRCPYCGEEFYTGFQAIEHNRRTAAAIRAEDGLLSPDEVRAIRTSYGLSQAALEALIGSGEKTVVRWESGTVAQTAAADTLLRVLRDHPEAVTKLAKERGVKVKLPKKTASDDRSVAVDGGAIEAASGGDVRHAA